MSDFAPPTKSEPLVPEAYEEGPPIPCMECCCVHCTAFKPSDFNGLCGSENQGVMYGCLGQNSRGCFVPKKVIGSELLLCQQAKIKCINPKVCMKGKCKQCCFRGRYALPFDEEDPCSCSVAGFSFAKMPPGQSIVWMAGKEPAGGPTNNMMAR